MRQFGIFADEELEVLDQDPDPDSRLVTYDRLASVAACLGLELRVSRDQFLEDIEDWSGEEDDSRLGGAGAVGGRMTDGDLDSMFETLIG